MASSAMQEIALSAQNLWKEGMKKEKTRQTEENGNVFQEVKEPKQTNKQTYK